MSADDIQDEVPVEFTKLLKALADETRLGVLMRLLKNGEMSFTDLLQDSGLTRANLSHHLRVLIQTALISNHYEKREGTDEFSFYEATQTARDSMDALIGVFQPRRTATYALQKMVEQNLVYDGEIGDFLEKSVYAPDSEASKYSIVAVFKQEPVNENEEVDGCSLLDPRRWKQELVI